MDQNIQTDEWWNDWHAYNIECRGVFGKYHCYFRLSGFLFVSICVGRPVQMNQVVGRLWKKTDQTVCTVSLGPDYALTTRIMYDLVPPFYMYACILSISHNMHSSHLRFRQSLHENEDKSCMIENDSQLQWKLGQISDCAWLIVYKCFEFSTRVCKFWVSVVCTKPLLSSHQQNV